jgi:hypothetical protein
MDTDMVMDTDIITFTTVTVTLTTTILVITPLTKRIKAKVINTKDMVMVIIPTVMDTPTIPPTKNTVLVFLKIFMLQPLAI